MGTIKVMVADDEPKIHEGMRILFESEGDIEIVAHANTFYEAIELADKHRPDVIIMDISFDADDPQHNGIEATRRIRFAWSEAKILIVTVYGSQDELIYEAMRAGARGYFVKEYPAGRLLAHIRTVADGGIIISSTVANRVERFFANMPATVVPQLFPQLNQTERDILAQWTQGILSNVEVAERLNLAVQTVKNYSSSILDKLEVASRAEAVAKALSKTRGQNQ